MMQTWEAIRFEKVLTSGRTRPLVIECEQIVSASGEELTEQTGESNDRRLMIVKSPGHPEVTTISLFCELMGNLLARELGLVTPVPGLINLSEEFVQAVAPQVAKEKVSLKPGIGAGCEYFKAGFKNPVPGAWQTSSEFEQSALLYGFDLLVQNPDRRLSNPNCAHNAGAYLVFDFEMCFSFLYTIGKRSKSWQVSQLEFRDKHLFHSSLKSKAPNWQPLIESLRGLSEQRLDLIAASLAGEWQEVYPAIREHLLEVVAHLPEFELELQRSLL